MAALSDIISISLSVASAPVRAAEFGLPAIVGNSNRFSEPGRYYTDTAGMLSDGFVASDPEVLAAGAVFSQNPSTSRILVGRRSLRSIPNAVLVPVAVNATVYTVWVQGVSASYTSDDTAAVLEIVAGLKSAIDALALPGVTTTNNTTDLSIAVATGSFLRLKVDATAGLAGPSNLSLDWTHADPGIATDLGILAAYSSDWYGLILAGSTSPAEVTAAAVWAGVNHKIFVHASNQSRIITTAAPGTDIAGAAKTAGYVYAAIIYHSDNGIFADAAIMGQRFSLPAGSEAWCDVQLASVPTDNLSPTHLVNLRAKNASYVTSFGGVVVFRDGKMAQGQWIDVIRGKDALSDDVQTSVWAVMLKNATAGKTPYTGAGAAAIGSAIVGALDRFERRGFLVTGSSTVTIPSVASQSAANKAARLFAGIAFASELASAIQSLTITGVVVE